MKCKFRNFYRAGGVAGQGAVDCWAGAAVAGAGVLAVAGFFAAAGFFAVAGFLTGRFFTGFGDGASVNSICTGFGRNSGKPFDAVTGSIVSLTG